MSRVWAARALSDGWVMECDTWDPKCPSRSEVGPLGALRLERFAAEGWFIARTHGDLCPTCVDAAGGMQVLLSREPGQVSSPHSVMLVAS